MPDITLNPVTPVSSGTVVGQLNPLPVLVIGSLTGAMSFSEISDPAAPAANIGLLYVRDTAGKSQLVIRFPTGAIQVIATEP